MIQDIEGATSEPARRGHVIALSAATAAISLVLLVALVVPLERVSVSPQATSLAPSASAGPMMTIVSGSTIPSGSALPPFRSGTISPLGVNTKVVMYCADGSRMDPPYYLVFEGNGNVMTVPLEASTTRSVPVASVDRGSGWLTVSCATSDARVPRIDRRR